MPDMVSLLPSGTALGFGFKCNPDRRGPSAMSAFRIKPSPNRQQTASLAGRSVNGRERRVGAENSRKGPAGLMPAGVLAR
jgi:hypothetical protein